MIKKTILMLLVLVGGVVSANAWDSVYLFYAGNSYSGTNDVFTKINANSFCFIVKSDNASWSGGSFFFRVNVKGDNNDWYQYGPSTDGQEITLTDYSQGKNDTRDYNAYKIVSNGTSTYYKINMNYDSSNEEWKISVSQSEMFNITYNDAANWNWNVVKLYAYIDNTLFNGSWPGLEMTKKTGENVYTASIEAFDGANIQFNDGSNSNEHNSLLVNKAVYSSAGSSISLTGINVSISNYGFATFCSTKAVDFSNETTIEACKASVTAGKITYTPVKKVAAGEGVLLRRVDGTLAAATAIVPLNNDQTISPASDNAFKAITTRQKLAQTTDGNTNYILTIVDETLGFYKVNSSGSWCAAGTAYLAVPTQQEAPDFIALDGETTGIENVSHEAVTNNQYYTLDGRRVAQPTKGLYIVNGKKVIIK